MKAIGYFRETPGPEGALASQNKAFLEFCQARGYEPAGTFVDSVSSNGHAPGFKELLAFLRQPGVHDDILVVVPDVRLLGLDLRQAIRHYFQLQGVGVQVADLRGSPDPEAELLRAWRDEDPASRVSDRVRAAMRRKAVKGEVLGRPPYGYKVGARRRLEVVPDEAVVVRYIFRLYLHEGMGIRLIARRLNEEDIRTRRGGRWSMVTIRDILRNRVYLGTYSRFGVRVPGSHQALVPPDDFAAVQDRLSSRRTSYAPRSISEFLLSGLARCGYCGNRLIGVTRRQAWKRKDGTAVSNVYRYYQCESRTNQSVCGYHTRRAERLESSVRESLRDVARAASPAPPPLEGDPPDHREREVERLRSRLRSLDRRLDGYVDAACKGRISAVRMHELSVLVAVERLATEEAIDAAEHRLAQRATGAPSREAQRAAARTLTDQWDNLAFAERQSALRDLIEHIVVTDDGVALALRA